MHNLNLPVQYHVSKSMACHKLREAILHSGPSHDSRNKMHIHIFCEHVSNILNSILKMECVALGRDLYLHVHTTSSLLAEFA